MSGLDVLIVTALDDEYDAVIEAPRKLGIKPAVEWRATTDLGYPAQVGSLPFAHNQRPLSVALMRLARMGPVQVAAAVQRVIASQDIRCLAMAGICAGNPEMVALGDVVIAEMSYLYDEGKMTEGGMVGDHRQTALPSEWLHAAQQFRLRASEFSIHGSASSEEAKIWLLERLQEEGSPRTHPAFNRYFRTNELWSSCRESLASGGLIDRAWGADPKITKKGVKYLNDLRYENVESPTQLPFAIHVGPMASGSAVVANGKVFATLRAQGVRSILAVDMEGAALATVRESNRIPYWVVVKGVVDYADPKKDDRYREFASTASAQILVEFLRARAGAGDLTDEKPRLSRTSLAAPREAFDVRGDLGDTPTAPSPFGCTRVEEFITKFGDQVAAARTPSQTQEVARALWLWVKENQMPYHTGTMEQLLHGVRRAALAASVMTRILPNYFARIYSVERGYRQATSFVTTESMRAAVEDVGGYELFREELLQRLEKLVRDRAAIAAFVSRKTGLEEAIIGLIDGTAAEVSTASLRNRLGLHWYRVGQDEKVEEYEIFDKRLVFRTAAPDRVIGLVSHMRKYEPDYLNAPRAPLSTELVDVEAWPLVLFPQFVGELTGLHEVGSIEDVWGLASETTETSTFRVGLV